MRQRPFVLEDVAQITAIDPTAAGRTPDEVFGFVLRGIADTVAQIFAARELPVH
jgi:hypothetical protein